MLILKLFTYLHDYRILDHTGSSQMFLCIHGIRLYKTLVTGGPGSKPDQNYVGEENMQDYV